jgi:hypothetical protein
MLDFGFDPDRLDREFAEQEAAHEAAMADGETLEAELERLAYLADEDAYQREIEL